MPLSGARQVAGIIGRSVEHHATIDSTNDRARALARSGAPHGLAVVADAQTAGRGQHGRAWHSPPGSGLYASFIVRPNTAPRDAPVLPLLTGVAVREAVASLTRAALGLKWPNDILVATPPYRGRKLAGILVEASATETRMDYAILGIGINIRALGRPPELAAYAIALDELPGTEECREQEPDQDDQHDEEHQANAIARATNLFPAVAEALESWLERASIEGMGPVLAAWTEHALGRGERVLVVDGDETHAGTLVGPGPDGALHLQTGTDPDDIRVFYRGALTIPGFPRPPDRPASGISP
ncbi:MAG: biotin--[acetyl-CoA-carboxylase] ligase [Deltaproteobacteria bacterium]|nr:biotin--[acetyl-CoA-carboxylase] ligase [Deltaproteobacteria bacterium]